MKSIEQIVQQAIKPLYVNPKQNILSEEYKQIQEKATNAEKAGFTHQASILRHRLKEQDQKDLYVEVMQKTGLKILLQRPNFNTNGSLVYPHITIEEHWRTHGKDLLLVEVPPSKYEEEVPQFAIDATLKAKEVGLEPMLWTVMQREKANQSLDPIVVGYITYKQNEEPNPLTTFREEAEKAYAEGNINQVYEIQRYVSTMLYFYTPSRPSITTNNYCLMIAAWGKDLEAIDSYFNQ